MRAGQSCACCVERQLAFALQKVGKGHLTLKEEQLSVIRSANDQEGAFSWLLTGFAKSIEYQCLPFYYITSRIVLMAVPLALCWLCHQPRPAY